MECPALRRVGVAPRGSRPPCPVTDSLARFCLGFDALLRLDIFRVLAQRGLLQTAWSDAAESGEPRGAPEPRWYPKAGVRAVRTMRLLSPDVLPRPQRSASEGVGVLCLTQHGHGFMPVMRSPSIAIENFRSLLER